MNRVSTGDGIRYGLNIFAYVVAVGIVAWVAIILGVYIGDTSSALGVLVIFAAIIVGLAGLAGLQFKVMADAVAMGLSLHDGASSEDTDSEPDLLGPKDDPFDETNDSGSV